MESHADGTPLGNDNLAGPSAKAQIRNHAGFIWSVADLLRGDYKRSEYGRVVLPLTVLRRLDGVLAPTKEQVLKQYEVCREGSTPFSTALPACSSTTLPS